MLSIEKKCYVKNLTVEENINQIILNNINLVKETLNTQRGDKPEDIIVMPNILNTMLEDVVSTVRNSKEGRVHLYGLKSPTGIITSDYSDVSKHILVDDVRFQTIEAIRNDLVEKLLGDYEVYVYTLNKLTRFNPTMINPEVSYFIRYKCIPRSEWTEMVRQVENRTLNGNMDSFSNEWLNHWIRIGDDARGRVETTEPTPEEDVKIESLITHNPIKKLKF